jgi:mono/diheme cytochrome c family protein
LITAIGAISAILACITGLVLESSGDYDGDAVSRHKFAGLSTALIATLYYVIRRKGGLLGIYPVRARWGSLIMLASVTITGHLGGDLTHGSGFIWKGTSFAGMDAASTGISEFRPVADVLEARAYPDLVSQVMQTKCVSCHGPSKQKGGLRLDDQVHMLKGGKNGIVINPGIAGNSELFKRLMLPPEDEHHMPPKEKPQLSDQDRALIEWWISKGADFNKTVKEIGIDDSTLAILRVYQTGKSESAQHTYEQLVPEENVPNADPALLDKLRNQGVVILQIDPSKGYLMANLINVTRPVDSLLVEMEPLHNQLIWLKLSGSDLSDAGCNPISRFNRLTRLQIDDTRITDNGLTAISTLDKLEKLNLAGDSITIKGLQQLKGMSSLKSLNIWKINNGNINMSEVFTILPSVKIDTGGYTLPFLSSDTMIVKDTRKK